MADFEEERASWGDDMRERMRDVAIKVARHELGHWFAAKDRGFEPKDLYIAIDQIRDTSHRGGAEVSKHKGLFCLDDVVSYLEGRIVTLWAGVLAESLRGSHVDRTIAQSLSETSGAMDFAIAAAHLRVLRNIKHPSTTDPDEAQRELTMLEAALMAQSQDVVETTSVAINSLAEKLAFQLDALGVDFPLSKNEIESAPETVTWLQNRRL